MYLTILARLQSDPVLINLVPCLDSECPCVPLCVADSSAPSCSARRLSAGMASSPRYTFVPSYGDRAEPPGELCDRLGLIPTTYDNIVLVFHSLWSDGDEFDSFMTIALNARLKDGCTRPRCRLSTEDAALLGWRLPMDEDVVLASGLHEKVSCARPPFRDGSDAPQSSPPPPKRVRASLDQPAQSASAQPGVSVSVEGALGEGGGESLGSNPLSD